MSELGSRLWELPIPPATQARDRAIGLAGEATGRSRRSRWKPRPSVALVALAALVGFAFTPPGEAVTRKIGELVGIGEPATLPPDNAGRYLTDRGQPLVIASGRAPDGTVYEVVANRSNEHGLIPGPEGASDARARMVTCVAVDLPEEPALDTVEACVGARDHEFLAGHVLDAVNYVDRARPGEERELAGSEARYVLSALVSPSVEEVEVTYESRSGARVDAYADVGRVSDEIGASLDTEDRVGYLVAFLPDDGLPSAVIKKGDGEGRRDAGILGTVRLVGRDGSDEVVVRRDFGRGVTGDFAKRKRQRAIEDRLEAEIAAAIRRDGLALNRANVSLCIEALRPPGNDRCDDLLREAAERGLYGLRTTGPGGEDIVLP